MQVQPHASPCRLLHAKVAECKSTEMGLIHTENDLQCHALKIDQYLPCFRRNTEESIGLEALIHSQGDT